jgi:hypothetical protein
MAIPTVPQNTPPKNARKYFRKAEQAEMLANQTPKKERAGTDAETSGLRASRPVEAVADEEALKKTEVQTDVKRPPRRPPHRKSPTARTIY